MSFVSLTKHVGVSGEIPRKQMSGEWMYFARTRDGFKIYNAAIRNANIFSLIHDLHSLVCGMRDSFKINTGIRIEKQ